MGRNNYKTYFKISIHTLCEEGDKLVSISWILASKFQSTPSVKRVTKDNNYTICGTLISIHTLCEEGDSG